MKRFLLVFGICVLLLAGMNVLFFRQYRSVTLENGSRYRITDIRPHGVYVRGARGARYLLEVSPSIWTDADGARVMARTYAFASQRAYVWYTMERNHPSKMVARRFTDFVGSTVSYAFSDGTTLQTSVTEETYPFYDNLPASLTPIAQSEMELFQFLLARYWHVRTFTWYLHNIVLGAAFLLLGVGLLCRTETFQRWGAVFNNNEYTEPPPLSAVLLRVAGGVITALVFGLHFILL